MCDLSGKDSVGIRTSLKEIQTLRIPTPRVRSGEEREREADVVVRLTDYRPRSIAYRPAARDSC